MANDIREEQIDLTEKFAKADKRRRIIFKILEVVMPIIVSVPTAILTALWLKGRL